MASLSGRGQKLKRPVKKALGNKLGTRRHYLLALTSAPFLAPLTHTASIDLLTDIIMEEKKDNQSCIRPFRVKSGCIVSIRSKHFEQQAKQNRKTLHWHWLDPIPNQDDTLTLIGKQILCISPKDHGSKDAAESVSRSFEGEVIAIHSQTPHHIHISLLVSTDMLPSLSSSSNPHIEVVPTQSADGASKNELQRRKLEMKIQGEDSQTVRLYLPKIQSKQAIRWAIRKRLSTAPGYIGDGNDNSERQEKNFRWIVNHQQQQQYSVDGEVNLGEVISVIPSCKQKGSLAKVTILPLKFIEDTVQGRMAHHEWNEICDVHSQEDKITSAPADDGQKTSTISLKHVEVPIENLIVIAKGAIRTENARTQDVADNELLIRTRYNENLKRFEPLNMDKSTGYRQCHRCKSLKGESHMGECQAPKCLDSKGEKKWWCKQCIRLLRKKCIFELRKNELFYGPCCLGQCDCKECTQTALIDPNGAKFQKKIADCCRRISSHGKHGKEVLGSDTSVDSCNMCMKKCCKYEVKCSTCNRVMHKDCFQREKDLWKATSKRLKGAKNVGDSPAPACFECRSLDSKSAMKSIGKKAGSASMIQMTAELVDFMAPINFSLPFDLECFPRPKSKPIEVVDRSPKRPRKEPSKTPKKKPNSKSVHAQTPLKSGDQQSLKIIDSSSKDADFKPETSRMMIYDASKKVMRGENNSAAHARSSLASMRKGGRTTISKPARREIGDNKKSSRTTRANQRRMLKDCWVTGGVKEIMTGCEHALRFGKSIIHGWGVFTDEEITSGDLIVEYRGVLIGNAVADRREVEYERAKIGSDYMFRMDSETVCDATHQGCVARFINASCTPNCHTQIITVNGVKRIAVYAKKDVDKGEELSYDYKFDLEFDESKRIPCNCGSSQCRGFMNWDQRYVAIKPQTAVTAC